MDDALKTKGIK